MDTGNYGERYHQMRRLCTKANAILAKISKWRCPTVIIQIVVISYKSKIAFNSDYYLNTDWRNTISKRYTSNIIRKVTHISLFMPHILNLLNNLSQAEVRQSVFVLFKKV